MTSLAIGAATVAPNPPWVWATVTATATLGLSAGAKPMNQGSVRLEPVAPIDAVPVLPATLMPPSWADWPVPSSTTLRIIWLISCGHRGLHDLVVYRRVERLHGCAVAVDDLGHEVRRHQLAAVGHRGHHHGHLHRRDEQSALADGDAADVDVAAARRVSGPCAP